MGPCTKGVDASHLRTQPFSAEKARSRAFALKPSFTLQLYRDAERRAMTSIAPVLQMSEPASFEDSSEPDSIATSGGPWETSETSSACRGATRKSYAARCPRPSVRRLQGTDPRVRGDRPHARITRVGPDLMPYESLSFPAFDYSRCSRRTGRTATSARVEYMLMIPVEGPKRTPSRHAGSAAVFWRPTTEDLELIRTRVGDVSDRDPERARQGPDPGVGDRRDPRTSSPP